MLFALLPLVARAAPLIDTRTGGIGLIGAASTHPASVLYNPATLGLSSPEMLHAFLDGTIRLGQVAVARHPIDLKTGAPSESGQSFDEVHGLERFPNGVFSVSSSLGSDAVVLCLALHTQGTEWISYLEGDERMWFDAAAQGPTRYHATDFLLYHVLSTLGAAYRVANEVIVGASTTLVYGELDLGFARDTAVDGGRMREAAQELVALDDCGGKRACDYESNDAAEAVRLRGAAWGVAFATGVIVRPHSRIDLGLAYVSRVFGVDGGAIVAKGDAWVRRSRAALANSAGSSPPLERDLSGRGSVRYALPDQVNFGATWRTTDRLLLELQLRWINLSLHDSLTMRLSGSMFRQQVPDRIVHYRGFQDVFAVQLGLGYRLLEGLTLQTAALVETSGVPTEALSPVAIDGTKLDALVALAWRLGSRFTLRAGYDLAWFPAVDVEESQFSSSAVVNCVDAAYDVDLRACKEAAAGRGLPTAAGTYELLVHRVGTSLSFALP